ncbi:IS66 family insertion sequence element accessory protein TnpB [Aquibacillus albus]|uniref:IS66 family insertion sequence element accessory protein TnpB n=1 Tax=Aquibacillus albus TaxID=1168171 RepID=UPI001958B6C2
MAVQIFVSLLISPCLFIFCNRKRDKLKILQWEHNGFGYITEGWNVVRVSLANIKRHCPFTYQ